MMLLVLAGCARAIDPATHAAGIVLALLLLSGPGLAWTGWCWRRQRSASSADPELLYRQAREQWGSRALEYERAELARLAYLPEWDSALPPARRVDVFGGTLAGWRSLLTVHGASLLAGQPLLVADLSGQLPSEPLAALARQAGVATAAWLLPGDLERSGILSRLTSAQLTDALVEAIHVGDDAKRSERAVDVRVLEQIAAALSPGGVTPARLACGVQVALGQPAAAGLLTAGEADLIRGTLFPDAFRARLAPHLLRLDAFLSDLAAWTGNGRGAGTGPAWCTCLAIAPGARNARAETLTALVVEWLSVQVAGTTASAPAIIVVAADEISRAHLERLADGCERRGVRLTLLFRHLRDETALGLIGGGGATAFMRLGNHHEAEQAATFIGRQHRFVLSGFTATHGRNQSSGFNTSRSSSHGDSRGWSAGSGGTSRSRERSSGGGWSAGVSAEEGSNWSDAATVERAYEYAVEPTVLQQLPEDALLLVSPGGGGALRSVECNPEIVALRRRIQGLRLSG